MVFEPIYLQRDELAVHRHFKLVGVEALAVAGDVLFLNDGVYLRRLLKIQQIVQMAEGEPDQKVCKKRTQSDTADPAAPAGSLPDPLDRHENTDGQAKSEGYFPKGDKRSLIKRICSYCIHEAHKGRQTAPESDAQPPRNDP